MVDGVSLMVSHPGNTSEYFVASGHSSTNHYSCLCSRIGATYMYTGVVPLFINDKYFCKEGTCHAQSQYRCWGVATISDTLTIFSIRKNPFFLILSTGMLATWFTCRLSHSHGTRQFLMAHFHWVVNWIEMIKWNLWLRRCDGVIKALIVGTLQKWF